MPAPLVGAAVQMGRVALTPVAKRLVSRLSKTKQSTAAKEKAIVAKAQTVGKRFDAEKAMRTPGRNSTERMRARSRR